MNKNILYGVVGLVVVVLAGIFIMKKPAAGPSGDANTPTPGEQMSLKELLLSGGAQRCTFTHATDVGESKGTVYVAGGKMRGDFESDSPQVGSMKSHMIVDGETSYVWTDAMPQGMKLSFATMGTQAESQGTSQSVDVNQKLDYDCGDWAVDQGVFALPSGVTFSDLGALLPPGGMPSLDGKPGTVDPSAGTVPAGSPGAAQCAMCAQAPDEDSRAQCLAALGCAAL